MRPSNIYDFIVWASFALWVLWVPQSAMAGLFWCALVALVAVLDRPQRLK